MSKASKNTEDDLLEEYNSEDEKNTTVKPKETSATKSDESYVGVHAAGFREFLLKPELLRAIQDCAFEHPSEVQHECIPAAILGTDVLCQAKSGMGKTAVFVLATLHQLDPNASTANGPQSIVLCHTRELAYQIRHEFIRFSKYLPNIKTEVIYGGVPVEQQKTLLKDKPPHIVIGTPGRVLQLVQEKALKCGNIKFFILDECDKMLESLDMRRDIQEVFKATPRDKQVLMFSATLSDTIRPICKKFMHNPLEIYINDGSKLTLHGLKQYYVEIQENAKNRKLIDLLDALEFNQVVIFVKSVARANALNKILQEGNFPSICIYGSMPQEERIERYRQFKEFQARIMVATDIFGRGIDVERVNVVINYDMPDSPDSYLHRVGRAGRFGTKGLAISFVSSDQDANILNDIQVRFVVGVSVLPDEIDSSTYM